VQYVVYRARTVPNRDLGDGAETEMETEMETGMETGKKKQKEKEKEKQRNNNAVRCSAHLSVRDANAQCAARQERVRKGVVGKSWGMVPCSLSAAGAEMLYEGSVRFENGGEDVFWVGAEVRDLEGVVGGIGKGKGGGGPGQVRVEREMVRVYARKRFDVWSRVFYVSGRREGGERGGKGQRVVFECGGEWEKGEVDGVGGEGVEMEIQNGGVSGQGEERSGDLGVGAGQVDGDGDGEGNGNGEGDKNTEGEEKAGEEHAREGDISGIQPVGPGDGNDDGNDERDDIPSPEPAGTRGGETNEDGLSKTRPVEAGEDNGEGNGDKDANGRAGEEDDISKTQPAATTTTENEAEESGKDSDDDDDNQPRPRTCESSTSTVDFPKHTNPLALNTATKLHGTFTTLSLANRAALSTFLELAKPRNGRIEDNHHYIYTVKPEMIDAFDEAGCGEGNCMVELEWDPPMGPRYRWEFQRLVVEVVVSELKGPVDLGDMVVELEGGGEDGGGGEVSGAGMKPTANLPSPLEESDEEMSEED
jgi:hypothetical protein